MVIAALPANAVEGDMDANTGTGLLPAPPLPLPPVVSDFEQEKKNNIPVTTASSLKDFIFYLFDYESTNLEIIFVLPCNKIIVDWLITIFFSSRQCFF